MHLRIFRDSAYFSVVSFCVAVLTRLQATVTWHTMVSRYSIAWVITPASGINALHSKQEVHVIYPLDPNTDQGAASATRKIRPEVIGVQML